MKFLQRLLLRFFFLAPLSFAAGAVADPGAGGGSSGSGSGGSGGSPSPSGAQPGSPSGTSGAGSGAQPPSPGQGQGTVDWATAPAHFRTAYDELKAKYSNWEKLNMAPELVSSYVQTAQGMVDESYQLGRQLGYKDSDIQEALANDVINTLTFLRQAAARAQAQLGRGGPGQGGQPRQGQIDPALQRMIDQRLSPLEEHTNNALVEAANTAFRGEYDRLFADHYKTDLQSVPKEVKDLLYDACSEVFKYNDKGMEGLKLRRDVAAVAETFKTVVNRFEAAMNAYHMWQLGKSGRGAGSQPGQGGGGRPSNQGPASGNQDGWGGLTLDDIATGDERAVKLIPSMR